MHLVHFMCVYVCVCWIRLLTFGNRYISPVMLTRAYSPGTAVACHMHYSAVLRWNTGPSLANQRQPQHFIITLFKTFTLSLSSPLTRLLLLLGTTVWCKSRSHVCLGAGSFPLLHLPALVHI